MAVILAIRVGREMRGVPNVVHLSTLLAFEPSVRGEASFPLSNLRPMRNLWALFNFEQPPTGAYIARRQCGHLFSPPLAKPL
jgi:hypothetical protein